MPSVEIQVSCDSTAFGEQVAILGSWNNWDKSNLTTLQTSPTTFPSWNTSLSLPSTPIEYKYAIVNKDRILRWEADTKGLNRVLHLQHQDQGTIHDRFGHIPHRSNPSHRTKPPPSSNHNFQRTNHVITLDHAHQHNLDPLEQAILKVTATQKSWRQRLSFVRALFTEPQAAADAGFDPSNIHHLATLSVYLTFLSTGQVRCDEDGGHHRPNHHAHEARRLESALARLTHDVVRTNYHGNTAYLPYVVRKIFPLLPSYSSQFTISVPLTRIRDIAHRGDIPRDFKLEIKHQLQNKLHRCAGPEDLQTSQRFLDRINANPNGYSHGFVEQFRIFHEELRAFFNAASTDERLAYLQSNANTTPVSHLAARLLSLKHSRAPALEQMEVLTELRQGIANLSLMNAQPDNDDELPSEDIQKTRLADIDLEGYAFLLLAGVAKDAEEQQTSNFNWLNALNGLSLTLNNIALSSICPEKAIATAHELTALNPTSSEWGLLRVKAAVDRASRFAESFSSAISDVYMRRVSSIGQALNVDQHAISVFAEAEIRSNITFQASRIADACRKACRKQLSLPPWDPLYTGDASGKLLRVDKLADLVVDEAEATILLCRHASGDEDIPPNVRGVVLGRPLPHLSHLGVRARQAEVVFVCSEDHGVFEEVWQRARYHFVSLVVDSANGLARFQELDTKDSAESSEIVTKSRQASLKPVEISFDGRITRPLPLGEATRQSTSSKCAFAGRLATISRSSGGLFLTADGVALPHGLFQKQRAKNAKRYEALVAEFSAAYDSKHGGQERVAESLQSFIKSNFVLEAKHYGDILKAFKKGAKVMVRSSANAEDLEDMSGAGLYDSIANVAIDSVEGLQGAVQEVWASLWTKRASSSRAAYNIPHQQVSMAILIQEMVAADLSFVGFSKDPVLKDAGKIYIEIAAGMGETLASAVEEGSPYRFRVNRKTLASEDLSFASYCHALVPNRKGNGLTRKVIDYSAQRMSTDSSFRKTIVSRISKTILHLEREFGGPQDVEGAVSMQDGKANVFIVQARPQIL
eukprot:GFKZ01009373.1.p1 GENE.GFKZ01009373.1~~GFKZ01009373.1.p1  ORF type:complete len:1038 (-),score=149.83 GFKZ01009373.1:829-3942(-)